MKRNKSWIQFDRLIDFVVVTSCFKYFAPIETSHCRWRTAKHKYMLNAFTLWAGKAFFVPHYLRHWTSVFVGLIWWTTLFSRLLRQAMGTNVMPNSNLFWSRCEYSFWKINFYSNGDVWSICGIVPWTLLWSLSKKIIFFYHYGLDVWFSCKEQFSKDNHIKYVRYVDQTKHHLTSRVNYLRTHHSHLCSMS